jgi:hypothetical protein
MAVAVKKGGCRLKKRGIEGLGLFDCYHVRKCPGAPWVSKPKRKSARDTNCAKSFVTREGVGRVAKVFVAPEVGLPWAEWIKT